MTFGGPLGAPIQLTGGSYKEASKGALGAPWGKGWCGVILKGC